jgi:hypothetical protein
LCLLLRNILSVQTVLDISPTHVFGHHLSGSTMAGTQLEVLPSLTEEVFVARKQ